MLKRFGEPSLTPDARRKSGSSPNRAVISLSRAIECQLRGAVDHAHASVPGLVFDHVAGDDIAGSRGGS